MLGCSGAWRGELRKVGPSETGLARGQGACGKDQWAPRLGVGVLKASPVLVVDSPKTAAQKGTCCYCIEADSGKARPADTTRVHFSNTINLLTTEKDS